MKLPEKIPDVVRISTKAGARFTPNEIRLLKAETGKTMEQLFGEKGDDADKMQTLVWLQLRREGIHVDWDACGDIAFEGVEEPADPTSSGPSTTSPASATSGG